MSSEMHETIKRFHDQKEPDFAENGIVYGGSEKGHHKNHAYKKNVERAETIGESSELEAIIAETVLKLNNIGLSDQSGDDNAQIELLDKKRKFALNKIKGLLDDISRYISSITAVDTVKMQREEINQKDYLAQFESADGNRRRTHNLLINDLQSTVSYIQYNFGKISEKALEKWEEEQEDKGEILLDIQRMTFPPKVVCPEHLNLNDRRQIADWAVQLALSLGKLKERLPRGGNLS